MASADAETKSNTGDVNMDPAAELKIVDFANWTNPNATEEQRAEVARQLVEACKTDGFVYITNHGMSSEKLAKAFEWSERLFDLSDEEKMEAPHPDGGRTHRGYSWPGLEKGGSEEEEQEHIDGHWEPFEAKESYEIGSELDKDQSNVWLPESTLPGFRAFEIRFYWECFDIGRNILRALAVGLGLPQDHLSKYHLGHNNQLRLLHYPTVPVVAMEAGAMDRMPAHTDWSSITMLFQDATGGLEIERQDGSGQYLHVSPVEDTLVMNVGDLLQRWTNDYLRSAKHRVTLPPSVPKLPPGEGSDRMLQPRYAIAYFLGPNPDSLIECLPTCTGPDRPPRYFPITQREYNAMRASKLYPTKAERAASKAEH